MAFMRASISNEPETWLITDHGDSEINTILPDGDYFDLDEADFIQIAKDHNLDVDEVREAYDEALNDANGQDFTIVTGYRGWLSAPGYLDRTSVTICDSIAEVALSLLDQYFDQPLEDMDDDELEDAEWLAGLANDVDLIDEIRAETDRRES